MLEVRFQLSLFGERIEFSTYAAAVEGLEDALEDAEGSLLPGKSPPHWYFESEAVVPLRATPNGASEEDIRSVMVTIGEGLEAISAAKSGDVQWPAALGDKGRRGIRQIVDALNDSVESIAMTGDGIRMITIEEVLPGRGRPKVFYDDYSAVVGVLDSVSVRGRPNFTVRQEWTNRTVRGYFALDMLDTVKAALSRRVEVEGLVRFREDGSMVSVSEIRRIRIDDREPRDILEFEGVLPNLTGGLSAEDYVRRLRGGVDE